MTSADQQRSPFAALVREHTPKFSESLRFIAAIVFEQRVLLFGSLLLLILSSFTMVLGPRILGYIVDEVNGTRNQETIYFLCFLFPLTEAIRLIASAAQSYSIARLGQRSLHSLRRRVYEQIERLPMRLHDRAKTGELMTFLSNDVQALSE